ncbi:hypothetical protein ANN_20672 [Periplaneta americana]|uniref:Uncharacterized protein n=1 Tax=Periplaneta americana TaxID=6978 RepID=A0ABQ8SD83_PERAM|nr:hypothetical protein ANN_20672 [Periplaneta americana]
MSPRSSTESYPAFARVRLRENPGKNLNQVTCPDRDSNPGHLVSRPDALTGLVKCFVWSVALYGAETWTLRRSEEERLEAFEMWIWRRMESVKWTERIRNEDMLERVGEERMMLKLIRKRRRNWLDHWLRRNCLLKDALERMVDGRRVRGRRKYQMIDDIKIYGSHKRGRQKIVKIGECWICTERPRSCTSTVRCTVNPDYDMDDDNDGDDDDDGM